MDWEIPSQWKLERFNAWSLLKGNGIKMKSFGGIQCVRYGELYTIYDHKVTQTESFVKDDIGVPMIGTLLMTGSVNS